MLSPVDTRTPPAAVAWSALLAPYCQPIVRTSLIQLGSTLGLLIACWGGMYFALAYSYWLVLVLAVPAALMTMRLFMLQHDCGHGAFFPSQRANNLVGAVLGVITLVPYAYWRRSLAFHHASSGYLEARGLGVVDSLTVRE
jgi:omega-6 fatty acid desaturase (delta-12 desaturase)